MAALSGLGDAGLDPVALDRRVGWALEHLVIDAALGRDDLVRLGRAAAAVEPAAVSSATLPVVPYPADVNRLVADPAAAPAAVAAFVAGHPRPPDAAAGGAPTGGPSPGEDALPGGSVIEPC